ncbi:hypothetical protein JOF29_001577 [Kribbella aluminosa]|uniref:Colicin D C-terminal domain-containing protein n=1 Tax=Kribbella aluminosa TaxID=416017 RepID=A0ABS4UFT2_9ACTN|nr:hypothetical protein [Kribbella aluminosa]MBP2350494.1 hypothetical protein [Kribbella aluminosa]
MVGPAGIGAAVGTAGVGGLIIAIQQIIDQILQNVAPGSGSSSNAGGADKSGTAAQPPDPDDDEEANRLAKNITKHSDESAARPDGEGSHYVSGVRPDQLETYVADVLKGRVPNIETRYLHNGRVGYWDPAKKAVVLEDGDGGSVYTPKNGYDYFKRLK